MDERKWEVTWMCDGKYRVDEVWAVGLTEAIDKAKEIMHGADFEHFFISVRML